MIEKRKKKSSIYVEFLLKHTRADESKNEKNVSIQLPSPILMSKTPLLVVIDLDYTLWPYYAHNVTNERVHKCVLFDGVTEVLQHLKVLQEKKHVIKVAIASVRHSHNSHIS